VRTLDPLPPDSRPYLDNIVRHQLERLVPWRAENVLHGRSAAPVGPRDERLVVTVWATARSLHEPVLSALDALHPRKLRLVYQDVPQAGGEAVIDIDSGGRNADRLRRIRQVAIAAVVIVLLAGGAAFAVLGYSWMNADEAIAANEQTVAGLRRQVAMRGGNPAGDRDLAAILARRRAQPLAAEAIDAMAAALPDDTWLTELQIAEGQIRVSGVSQSVAELVPLVQAAPVLAEAAFYAPTTRLPDGSGDRFHLQSRLVPAGDKK
jgi:general secretion pathway protein L